MKKIIFFVSLLTIASLTTILPVSAQEATSSVDLGVENPGILPTSPFYFLKEWKRGVNKFFTFNPVKKAELELDEINQRAAEIKKMEEIAPQNIEAINKASSNYQKNAEQLKNRLEALKETGQNPNVDKLLDKLVDRSLKHQELFDNLEKKFEARQEISEQKITELKEKFEVNRERINDIMVKVPEKFENADSFNKRLEKAIENQPEGMIKKFETLMEKNEKRGFKSVYWQCYDGTEQKQRDETSCQLSEVWQKRAKEFCENKCYSDGSKCGVNSFRVLEECGSNSESVRPIQAPFVKQMPINENRSNREEKLEVKTGVNIPQIPLMPKY